MDHNVSANLYTWLGKTIYFLKLSHHFNDLDNQCRHIQTCNHNKLNNFVLDEIRLHAPKQLENWHFSSSAFAISNLFSAISGKDMYSSRRTSVIGSHTSRTNLEIVTLLIKYFDKRLLSLVTRNQNIMLRFSSRMICFRNLTVFFSNLVHVFDSNI